jgi:glycosyltransferase involved in cell wall biosynthesis
LILSILIPTLPERIEKFNKLFFDINFQLEKQNAFGIVEILIDEAPKGKSIGQKRNELLQKATGEYICFIDDDDKISDEYLRLVLKALKSKPDCLSLRGVITFDGHEPKLFEHSIKYSEYRTTANVITYERYPNHLNVIKSSIAKQFTFPEINFGEDTDWATQINKSGLLKKEVYIEEIIYYYKYVSNK